MPVNLSIDENEERKTSNYVFQHLETLMAIKHQSTFNMNVYFIHIILTLQHRYQASHSHLTYYISVYHTCSQC